MIEYNQLEQGEIPSDTELGVKVIGVGGAGANVLDRMALEGSDDAELLTLNTDVRALSTSVSSDKIQLGSTLLKGMGTGGDPSLGKQAALEAVDEIRAAVREKGIIFICVGLGGGTGSGAAPEVCRRGLVEPSRPAMLSQPLANTPMLLSRSTMIAWVSSSFPRTV